MLGLPSIRPRLLLLLYLSWLALAGAGCRAVPPPPDANAPAPPAAQAAPRTGAPPVPSTSNAAHWLAAQLNRPSAASPAARAFYGPAPALAWTAAPPADTLGAAARDLLALLAQASDYGLRPTTYALPQLRALRDSLAVRAPKAAGAARRAAQLARFDLSLTRAALAFAGDLRGGRPRPAGPAAAALRAALATPALRAALLAAQPTNREYRQLQLALARWLARVGPPDSAAPLQRARFERVALNLVRWRAAPLAEAEYLLINIPAFEMQVVRHDTVLRRYRVIVGKPATPTPTLSSRLKYFTLGPVWTVPYSIATKEMLPRLQNDPGFLDEENLTLYDGRHRVRDPREVDWSTVKAATFAYGLQQDSGPRNALGNYVFHFPNPYLVYLHDTPQRQAFTRPNRALSHGCIRLEHPRELAAWLLRREANSTPLITPAQARQSPPQNILLRRPLPIFIRYATATAENGRLRFYPDVYGSDQALHEALYCR